jgi:hypothetical protein
MRRLATRIHYIRASTHARQGLEERPDARQPWRTGWTSPAHGGFNAEKGRRQQAPPRQQHPDADTTRSRDRCAERSQQKGNE